MFDSTLYSSPRRSPFHFAASVAAHVVTVSALALLAPIQRPAPSPPPVRELARVVLTAPARLAPPQAPARRPQPNRGVQPVERARLAPPRVEPPTPRQAEPAVEAPVIQPATAVATPAAPPPPVPKVQPPPKPLPGFESARATELRPESAAEEPRKGLFSTAAAKGAAPVKIDAALTASAGFGNSTVGGADGKPGPAPTTTGGFGGVSTRASATGPAPVQVRPGGFAAAESRRASTGPAERALTAPAAASPVRILAKPDPVYTDEARTLRLEGDVVLEALFTRGGAVEQVRVVRGLGHGLDEAAVAAVLGIDFEPASRAGVAEDARLRLTVRFQLAY